MRNKSSKLQFKFTIEFSVFFLILLTAIYIYIIRTFEADVYEKYVYKSEVFSNFFEQNPEKLKTLKIKDKETLTKLVELNEALYLVVESSDQSIIGAVNIDVAEQKLYILDQTSDIPKNNPVFKISFPIIYDGAEKGKVYVGFEAGKKVADLHKIKLLFALLAFAVFIIVTISTYLFSARSFKPITKLISTLDTIIKGDKNTKIEEKSKNEIGMLAEKINLLLKQLDKSTERVKYLNAKLGAAFKEKIYELDSEISQRKKMELSLHKSEKQFELVFENAPIGMFIVSPFNKILNVNKAFCDITGYYKRELIGSHIKMLFDDFREANFITASDQRHINFYDLNSEKMMIKKNKDKINIIAKSVTIFDHKSIPQHAIVQTLDITEIKKTQKDLMIALEKAEESNRLKSAFLAQMSHEIRTPLNAILTAVPILADEMDKENDDVQMIINSVDSAGKRLQRTIDMILNMSAVQTGNYKPDFESVNIETELAKLIREFKHLSEEKNLELNFRCLSKHPYVYCDAYTTNQIFQNLIGNSIKYTHQGSISISIENSENDSVTVFIKDTGIGMTKDYMERLFSPFSQEDAGQKREYEGNGLGLALVKKYIEINNADILVQSEKNLGSVFAVTFKKYKENNESMENTILESYPKAVKS